MKRKNFLRMAHYAAGLLVIQPVNGAHTIQRAGHGLSDEEAIRSDFAMVGSDITDAINNYGKRNKQEARAAE